CVRTLLSVLLLAVTLAIAPASASAQPLPGPRPEAATGEPKELVRALQAGGYVILVRHGATFSNQADTDPFNLADVSKQRNLHQEGKTLAQNLGDAPPAAAW